MPDVGGTYVTISPDLSGFLAKLAAGVNAATSAVNANVGVTANTAVVQAQLSALGAEVITPKVDLNITDALIQIGELRAELDALGVDFNALFGEGGAAGGGGGGANLGGAGALGGMAANILLVMHAIHLIMPEILGLVAATIAAGAGFAVLGVAASSTVSDIMAGNTAVSNANDAIAKAIPGTTQWATGIGQLGTAWSGIPSALQPAVAAIQNFLNHLNGGEVQRWAVATIDSVLQMGTKASGAFQPLLLATERAFDTLLSIIDKSLGSGGMTKMISTLSAMVGPATIEIAQLVEAIGRLVVGFASAVQGGEGMEFLVQLFRTLGDVVNSSFMSGFISGWVDFDRLVTGLAATIIHIIGVVGQASSSLHDFGVVIGFVVSAFAMLAAVTSVSSWIAGIGAAGVAGAAGLVTFTAAVRGVMVSLLGPLALVAGVTMLSAELSKLTGIADPVAAVWHGIADAIGIGTKAFAGSASTIQEYNKQLSDGTIPVTKQLTDAQDLLNRSEQSIGASLGGMTAGFTAWSLKAVDATTTLQGFDAAVTGVTDSVSAMIANLTGQNQDLAQWAADAQILIQRGMDPSAVASLAQQAPQDLASMVTATTAQLQQMNVQWQEKMLEATMSGKTGIEGFITALETGIKSGTPVVQQAAIALATTIGAAIGVPFTGTEASVKQIGVALNNLPVSVVEALAGKTTQLSAASSDAAGSAAKLGTASTTANQSVTTTILTIGSSVALVALGLKSTITLLGSMISWVGNLASSMLGLGAAEDVAAAGAGTEEAANIGLAGSLAGVEGAAAGAGGAAGLGGLSAMVGPVGFALGALAFVVFGTAAELKHLQDNVTNAANAALATDPTWKKLAGDIGAASTAISDSQKPTGGAIGSYQQLTNEASKLSTAIQDIVSKETSVAVAQYTNADASNAALKSWQQSLATLPGLQNQLAVTDASLALLGSGWSTSAVQSANWSKIVSTNSALVTQVSKTNNAGMIADLQNAMGLYDTVLAGGGAKAIQDFLTAHNISIPAYEQILAQYSSVLPKSAMTLLESVLGPGGATAVAAFVKALNEGAVPAAAAATGLAQAVIDANAIVVLPSGMYSAGTNAGQSLANGLNAMLSAVQIAANALGVAAATGTNKAMGAASPAKVFIAIGQNAGASFASGIASQVGVVTSAAGLLVASALGAMRGTAIQLPTTTTGVLGGTAIDVTGQLTTGAAADAIAQIAATLGISTAAAMNAFPSVNPLAALGLGNASTSPISPTYHVTINGTNLSPSQLETTIKSALKAHDADLLNQITAGSRGRA